MSSQRPPLALTHPYVELSALQADGSVVTFAALERDVPDLLAYWESVMHVLPTGRRSTGITGEMHDPSECE